MLARSTRRAAVSGGLCRFAAGISFLLSACSDTGNPVNPSDAPTAPAIEDPSPGIAGEVIPGSFIVVFTPATSDPRGLADQLIREHGGAVRFTYSSALRGFAADLPDRAVEALKHNPNIAYVEPDQTVQLFEAQTTPPWGLDRVDQRTLPLSASYSYTATGGGVNVYIIDTGIRTTHAEFGGRAVGAFNGVKGKYTTDDCHGHGTHVAGTVGGSTYGVAKGVKLYGVRVLDCYGNGTWSAIIAGIDWVTANRQLPAVANMSLGGGYSQAVNDAVEASIRSGVTYTLAAGNSSWDACNISPASAPSAITVGASDSLDQQAAFSNYGTCLDVYAPGLRVKSAWMASDTATKIGSGTSMASPHAAGAAALYVETHSGATPAEVAQALVGSATAGQISKIGAGSPNLLLFTGDPASAQPGSGEGGGGGGSGPCKQPWQKGCA